jgi:hypothetical protein
VTVFGSFSLRRSMRAIQSEIVALDVREGMDGKIDSGDQGLMNRSNCLRNPDQLGCPKCQAG